MKSSSARRASIQIEPRGAATVADRLDGITHQVQHDLLNLQDIHQYRRKTRGQVCVCRYPGPVKVRLAQFDDSLDDTLEADGCTIAAIEPY